jgi:hypothetical protein
MLRPGIRIRGKIVFWSVRDQISGKARAGVGVWERMFSKLEDIARISTLRRMLPERSPAKEAAPEWCKPVHDRATSASSARTSP